MSNPKDLLACFRRMTSQDIHRLPACQKNELLAIFQAELSHSHHDKTLKHKQISKYRTAISYKDYIRRRMPSIIRKMITRTQQEARTQIIHQREISMKLKKGTATSRKKRIEGFEEYLGAMVREGSHEELSCSICLQTMIHPVLTVCGHAFCFQCLDESLLFSSSCPNCRESIKGVQLIGCALLDRLIRRTAPQTYQERLKKFIQWKGNREVDIGTLKPGMEVDVRDTENIWCEGTVVEVQWQQDGPSTVLVHFNRWNNIYNQIIELPSLRLAPLHFFSKRTDIPRYNLSLHDDNMRGLVISGPAEPHPNAIEVDDSSSEEELDNINANSLQQQQPRQPLAEAHLPLFAPPFQNGTNSAIGDFLSNWSFSRIFRAPSHMQNNSVDQIGSQSEEMVDDIENEEDEVQEDNQDEVIEDA